MEKHFTMTEKEMNAMPWNIICHYTVEQRTLRETIWYCLSCNLFHYAQKAFFIMLEKTLDKSFGEDTKRIDDRDKMSNVICQCLQAYFGVISSRFVADITYRFSWQDRCNILLNEYDNHIGALYSPDGFKQLLKWFHSAKENGIPIVLVNEPKVVSIKSLIDLWTDEAITVGAVKTIVDFQEFMHISGAIDRILNKIDLGSMERFESLS